MARLPTKEELCDQVVAAFQAGGSAIIYLSDLHAHPLRLRVLSGSEREQGITVLVYIWNLTYGGAPRSTQEFRIQVTGVSSLDIEPNVVTLLLGWWEEGGVFAAFDASRHQRQVGQGRRSPSIQIGQTALESARTNGTAAYEKESGEIAFAVRPDMLTTYVKEHSTLHEFGESQDTVNLIDQALQPDAEVNNDVLESQSPERREAIRTIRQKVRDAQFRRTVLAAYGQRCAWCRVQLGLVEAAHIVPVAHPKSKDVVSNGIALCVLHHKAYDQRLISMETSESGYAVMLNGREISRLKALRLDGGFEEFKGNVKLPPHLPDVVSDRPNAEFLREGNSLRGWAALAKHDVIVLS